MADCELCGRRILWCVNDRTGRGAPVDPTPVDDGNVVLDGNRYHVLSKDEAVEMDGDLFRPRNPRPRYILHFVTCPHADKFRRCKKCRQAPCSCKEKV